MTMKRAYRTLLIGAVGLALLSCAKTPAKNSGGKNNDLTQAFGVDSDSSANSSATAAQSQPSADDFAGSQGVAKTDLLAVSSALKERSEPKLIKAASNVLSRDPSQVETLNALAVYYYQSQKFGMAKIILKRALKDHPNEPALYNNLGVVYLAQGHMQRALNSFKKSLQVKTGYRIGATNLSSIYLDYRDYSRGLAPLEQSYKDTRSELAQGDPSAVAIANNYAVALMGVGEGGKAKDVFDDIVRSNQQNPIPVLNDAILLVEVLKKKNDAIRVISKLKFMTEDSGILRRVSALEQELGSQQ